ncbi:hypothetical protein OC846_005934 [Tilletia horrida]|uniref:Uncharacterized protein n=1 Tax=Tilletia horrida TaxID=155126 RepID=A0AAN6JVI3_9BASI|nr:hypothetical protein OC846_005934 [Tilletia horrida]KAK0560913.1 hypothetical protein OC861_006074 [Tilletia horrida]
MMTARRPSQPFLGIGPTSYRLRSITSDPDPVKKSPDGISRSTMATTSPSQAGGPDHRNSARLSTDYASYMHLSDRLESAESDPSVIVVKQQSPRSQQHHQQSADSYSPMETMSPQEARKGELRKSGATAITSITDDLSDYGEGEVILSATRVGLKRSPSAGASLVFNKAGAGNASSTAPTSATTTSSNSVETSTLANAGILDSARTSFGEESVNRHRNSNPSRYSNGTSGWQTPSEAHSQQSPRSSRSVRPLTLPPTEPLPPLPSPNGTTPNLPTESPEVSSPGPSRGSLSAGASGSGPSGSSPSAPLKGSRALGIELKSSPPSNTAATGTVARLRANLESSSSPNGSPSSTNKDLRQRSPSAPFTNKMSNEERKFAERIDRSADSVTSSASASSNAIPSGVHGGPAIGRHNGESTSTVTSPVTPTAATMQGAVPAAAAAATATPAQPSTRNASVSSTTERNPPSAAGRAQAIFNSTAAARNPLAGARTAASEQVHGSGRAGSSQAGPKILTRRASDLNLQSRRNEMEEDREIVKGAPQQRAVILKKAETRFAGAFTEVAQAFKQLQAEKRTLENIIRATTPLDGLGDQGQLSEYLRSMTAKVASSEEEIRKLLELLEQQRAVMDYMLETHERETDAHYDQVDELHVQLDILTEEAETHRANCVQLTAELERAHNECVSARSDVLKLRAAVQQETSKCEQAMTLLRALQRQMKDSEKSSKQTKNELESLRAQQDDRDHARGRDEDMNSTLSTQHAKELASLSAELRRDLSSKHEADLVSRSEQIRADLGARHAEELDALSRQVRSELTTQHKGELKAMKAKLDSSLTLANAEADQRLAQVTSAHESELKKLQARLGKLEREGEAKTNLENELRELRAQHVTLVNQLADRTNGMNELEEKSRALEKEAVSLRSVAAAASAPPPVPSKGEEPNVAGLMAQVQALEARAKAAEAAKEEALAKVTQLEDGGSKSELASLRTQLVDQRAREVQIRNAYKNLQYELRKTHQNKQNEDRKRGFLTGLGPSGSGRSISGHGSISGQGALPTSPIDAPYGLARSPSNSSQTNRNLKRLSLPVVSKGSTVLPSNWMETYQKENGLSSSAGGAGSGSRPTSSSSTNFSHPMGMPPSSYRPVPGVSAIGRNSFSTTPSPPHRRASHADALDDDGASSTGGTASIHGNGGSGGVLGYGSSGVHAYGPSTGAAATNPPTTTQAATGTGAGSSGNHRDRPLSEASAYSIDEAEEEEEEEGDEDEEVINSDVPLAHQRKLP